MKRLCALTCVLFVLAPAVASAAWPRPPAWWFSSSVVACIRSRESGNGTTTSNVYGMLAGWAQAGGSGSAGSASRAEQDYRAYRLYQWALQRFGYGWAPWHPYDGCG